MRKDMQKEIRKYQGCIYYFDTESKTLCKAEWIQTTADYDHYSFELHHFVPFTDWEKNTKNVRSKVNNKLILLPKVMHQHLENPIYKLSQSDYERVYGIHPNKILYDINSNLDRLHNIPNLSHSIPSGATSNVPGISLLSDEDLSCFDDIKEARYA